MASRRDYEAMAELIRNTESFASELGRARFAHEAATLYEQDNPRFNRERFIRACMPSWVAGTRAEVHYERVMTNG